MLPLRDGVNPSRLRLPGEPLWPTVLDYLLERFSAESDRIAEKVRAGDVVDERGDPVTTQTPYRPHRMIYVYRDLPDEVPVPYEIEILHRDDDLLVVDKPHFLATTPNGGNVAQTALVRLRRQLDLPELAPAHRLDRLTAGVLVFTVRVSARQVYQSLFADRTVRKEYEAIAGYDAALTLPRTVRSHIVKHRGILQAEEVAREPNSETHIELIEHLGELARYRLLPHTGKTHQLRVHLNSLGIPIVGDDLYPTVRTITRGDFSDPLRLLARSLEFVDPVTGRRRLFVSRRSLALP